MIFLENKNLRGPNIELEAHLIRFYVVVCNQYIIPMIGRISHISSDESKQVHRFQIHMLFSKILMRIQSTLRSLIFVLHSIS